MGVVGGDEVAFLGRSRSSPVENSKERGGSEGAGPVVVDEECDEECEGCLCNPSI